jgi:hypothetical protein
MYTVIGERIESSSIDIEQKVLDRNDVDFSNYQSAVDYYDTTFSDVAKDVCHLGGEFVITMFHKGKIVKRHMVSTTINNEQS